MAVEKPTPEEKLFAVIQGAKHPPLRGKTRGLSLADVGQRVAAFVGTMDLPTINRLLTGLLAVLAGLCVVSPLVMRPRVDQVLASAEEHTAPFVFPPPLEGLKPAEAYAELIRQQDPFHLESATVTPPPPPQQPQEPPKPSAKEAVAGFKLVGISWGRDPVAMIEQVKTSQTSFLKAGDTLGPATVKEILPDRVILRVGDEDVELY